MKIDSAPGPSPIHQVQRHQHVPFKKGHRRLSKQLHLLGISHTGRMARIGTEDIHRSKCSEGAQSFTPNFESQTRPHKMGLRQKLWKLGGGGCCHENRGLKSGDPI